LHAHVYTVNGEIPYSYTDSPIHCLYMYIQLYGFHHSLFIHGHTTIRILPFSVYTCIYNYADSPIHCLYMYIQLYGFPSVYLYVHVYTVNGGIRIVVCLCINSEWGIRIVVHCVYMYIQPYGFPHSLCIHVHTTIQIPSFTVYTCIYNYTDSPIHW
jgi:hypothetical protein